MDVLNRANISGVRKSMLLFVLFMYAMNQQEFRAEAFKFNLLNQHSVDVNIITMFYVWTMDAV